MVYNFDIDVAKEYGVDEAIMIANFQYWIIKNKASNKHFYNGHYWTYNSTKAFVELFPFWNQRHIELVLKKLIEKGILIKGNYNQSAYDRTCWYAFADEEKWIYNIKEIHLQKNVNGNTEKCKPIPDNKPNIEKPNKKPDKEYIVFGEFKNVKLTSEQVKKLIKDYEWYFEDAINALSSYLEFKGDKYKSHYATILNWSRKEGVNEPTRIYRQQKHNQILSVTD